jgi:adenylate cyclase
MGTEIERKFLVKDDSWRHNVSAKKYIVQGYMARDKGVTLRVRIIDYVRAVITIKVGGSSLSRSEFEYLVPLEDGRAMMALCGDAKIEKTRHDVDVEGFKWEIDVFSGAHEGLMLAEIELSEEDQHFAKPEWLGAEVSTDPAYYNSTLAGIGKFANRKPNLA